MVKKDEMGLRDFFCWRWFVVKSLQLVSRWGLEDFVTHDSVCKFWSGPCFFPNYILLMQWSIMSLKMSASQRLIRKHLKRTINLPYPLPPSLHSNDYTHARARSKKIIRI